MKIYEVSLNGTASVVHFTKEKAASAFIKEAKDDPENTEIELSTFKVRLNADIILRLLNGQGGYAEEMVTVFRLERNETTQAWEVGDL